MTTVRIPAEMYMVCDLCGVSSKDRSSWFVKDAGVTTRSKPIDASGLPCGDLCYESYDLCDTCSDAVIHAIHEIVAERTRQKEELG